MKKTKKGFTIIELLVSVAILMVLMGTVMVSVGGSRAKSRDAKKVTEIKQLQNALQLYYNDNATYPATLSVDALVPTYIKVIPTDPGGNNYLYASFKSGEHCDDYHLGAILEKAVASSDILSNDFDYDSSTISALCPGSASGFDGSDVGPTPIYDVRP